MNVYDPTIHHGLDRIHRVWMIINDKQEIIQWSHAAKEQFGYDFHEVENQPFSILLPDSELDKDIYFEKLRVNAHSGAVLSQRTNLLQKNQVIINTEISVFDLSGFNSTVHLIFVENVTEDVELQQLVNQRKEDISEKIHLTSDPLFPEMTDEIIDAILVSITAGQGLKYNRCFLYLVNEEKHILEGVKAIGPGSNEEAGDIYHKFDDMPRTLTEMIAHYHSLQINKDDAVNNLVRSFKIDLSDYDNILIQTLFSQKYLLINDECSLIEEPSVQNLRFKLGVHECVLLPLIWHEHPIGLIIADNQVTKSPITNLNIRSLIRFGKTSANALESIRLLSKLDRAMSQSKEANIRLKESQSELVEQEKLITKSELVANMAHEVRGPISIIGGYARRIQKEVGITESTREAVDIIIDTINTLELVVSDILDQTSKAQPILHSCDGAKTINKVISLLEEEILGRKISVNINIQGSMPNLKIKEHHLFEIVHNLVKNAIEAVEQEGLLLIVANSNNQECVITIQDTGPGLTPEAEKNLFSRFFSTKKSGTGLGLVVVQKLVQQYGGDIKLSSIPGRGTTVLLKIPTVE